VDDQVTEPVQSEEVETDQGGEATGSPPYQSYLDRIPEEVRDDVESVFKDWDADYTRKSQEHAEYRKSWEPYEQAGINQLSPEQAQYGAQLVQALDDPQAMQQWWNAYAEQAGLTPQEAAQQQSEQAAPTLDEFMGTSDTQQLQELLKQELSPLQQQIQQMTEWRDQQEYSTRLAEAERYVNGQIETLKAKHPDEFNQDAIEKLVVNYMNDPEHAVERAFADWQTIRAQIERDTLQGKANQPAPAESGGVANAAAEETTSMAEAGDRTREFLRHMNS
jgi:hypothetical protein